MWGCKMNELNFQQELGRLCLQIITPVNIADGTKLTAKDYFYEPQKQKAYFLHLHKWHQFVYEHGLLEAYEKYVSNAEDKRNLLTWLKAQKFTLADVKNIIVSEAQATVNVENKNTLNDVDKHIHQVDGSLYVPGSSMKGVFRGAILYALLMRNPDIKNKYWEEVYLDIKQLDLLDRELNALNEEKRNTDRDDKRRLDEIKKKIKEANDNKKKTFNRINNTANKIETILLNALTLDLQNKSNAINCSLRGLQVSDTLCNENMQVAILQKVDAGFFREPNYLSTFKECMLPGAKLYFTVKLDKAMLATIGINSIDALLNVTQNYFDAVTSLLRAAFGKQHPEQFRGIENANMFLGSNTGFLSKTLLALLAPDAQAAKEAIKILLDKSFKGHKHFMRDKIISPRTLKCTNYNGKIILMGLAEVRRV